MPKQIQIKKSIEYLKKDFPENLIITKKLPKKYQRITREKKLIYGLLKKRIKKIENTILKNTNIKIKSQNVQILFSSEQYKNDVLKKQHQQKSCSDFYMKLKEKKKISIIYGNTSNKFFDKAFSQAKQLKGNKTENLLVQYEKRLDVLLYRICFSKNIQTAKQYITHNLVYVNGKILNIPSYQVKAGDIISIDKLKHLYITNNFLDYLKKIITKRKYRFLISYKILQKYITKEQEKNKKEFKIYKPIQKSTNRLYIKKKISSSIDNKFLNNKLKTLKLKLLSVNKNKTKWKKIKNYKNQYKTLNVLETLTKIAFIRTLFLETKNKSCDNFSLDFYSNFLKLKIKRILHRRQSYRNRIFAMQISPMKPLHVEISFKLLKAVVLFSPQKLVYPTLFNTDYLVRS